VARLVAEGITVREAFASWCAYGPGEVFVDDEPLRRLGWGSLVDSARLVRPVAVLVPDVAGLRLPAGQVEGLRGRLRRVTNAPSVLAGPVAAVSGFAESVAGPGAAPPGQRGSAVPSHWRRASS
jgi:hypothetical protein